MIVWSRGPFDAERRLRPRRPGHRLGLGRPRIGDHAAPAPSDARDDPAAGRDMGRSRRGARQALRHSQAGCGIVILRPPSPLDDQKIRFSE